MIVYFCSRYYHSYCFVSTVSNGAQQKPQAPTHKINICSECGINAKVLDPYLVSSVSTSISWCVQFLFTSHKNMLNEISCSTFVGITAEKQKKHIFILILTSDLHSLCLKAPTV